MADATLRSTSLRSTSNKLYYGDNLDVLRRYVADESVDLVYLDPPFKSNQDYNVLFQERNGSQSAAQIKAFEDTWRWSLEAEAAYGEVVEAGGPVSQFMQGMRSFLGENDMMAYLSMMAPRLAELRRVLKPTGSIYLHCDPTASAHLRLLMDAVFGAGNFLNEIVWCYDTGGRSTTSFPRKHDVVLRYAKTKTAAFYYDNVALPRDPSTMHETVLTDEQGRKYQRNIKGGKEYRYYLDKGVLPNDWWMDIQALNPAAKERLGYPTQKPLALLERIIKASSNEGDVVLDPFCGCGTAVVAAQKLNRRWIGIDVTHLAVTLIKHRLRDTFPDKVINEEKVERGVEYDVVGEPADLAGASALAMQDPFQFQYWALGLVGARPTEEKKGADRGIDGRLYFHDEADTRKTKQVILQVKAGHVGVKDVRDLVGVLDREKAQIGALISLEAPTRPMVTEAAAAGFYAHPVLEAQYPRIQLLTVSEILRGKALEYPPRTSATFKRAPRARGRKGHRQAELGEA
jgi:site-specific DNA-methyltransferase (adenine-specific)